MYLSVHLQAGEFSGHDYFVYSTKIKWEKPLYIYVLVCITTLEYGLFVRFCQVTYSAL